MIIVCETKWVSKTVNATEETIRITTHVEGGLCGVKVGACPSYQTYSVHSLRKLSGYFTRDL
uniref:Uncharacterized protein n=1 Tax=Arion vulgaris TaxID=1028688 RepID=A0A0B7A6Q7_9EUPU